MLVPSLSFCFFQLLEQDVPGPAEMLRELFDYLGATFLHADLGSGNFQNQTFIRTRSAFSVISDGFIVDIALLGGALVAGVLIGLLAGAVQAVWPRSFASRAIAVMTAFMLSSPVYWLGLLMLLFFAPGIGSVAEIPFLSTVGGYRSPGDDPVAFVQALWLPCLIISAPLAAACTRMAAGQLGGTLHEDFVRTARGKGLRRGRVVRHHAMPVASAPVIALIAVNMNLIITNAALVETVFNIPGGFRYMERALDQPRRRPRAGADRRGDVLHRRRELHRRRGHRVARPAGAGEHVTVRRPRPQAAACSAQSRYSRQ